MSCSMPASRLSVAWDVASRIQLNLGAARQTSLASSLWHPLCLLPSYVRHAGHRSSTDMLDLTPIQFANDRRKLARYPCCSRVLYGRAVISRMMALACQCPAPSMPLLPGSPGLTFGMLLYNRNLLFIRRQEARHVAFCLGPQCYRGLLCLSRATTTPESCREALHMNRAGSIELS